MLPCRWCCFQIFPLCTSLVWLGMKSLDFKFNFDVPGFQRGCTKLTSHPGTTLYLMGLSSILGGQQWVIVNIRCQNSNFHRAQYSHVAMRWWTHSSYLHGLDNQKSFIAILLFSEPWARSWGDVRSKLPSLLTETCLTSHQLPPISGLFGTLVLTIPLVPSQHAGVACHYSYGLVWKESLQVEFLEEKEAYSWSHEARRTRQL